MNIKIFQVEPLVMMAAGNKLFEDLRSISESLGYLLSYEYTCETFIDVTTFICFLFAGLSYIERVNLQNLFQTSNGCLSITL